MAATKTLPSATPPAPPAPPTANDPPYIIKISRLTIDKLGVKLYDTVSAAVAELVANAYDADADSVVIKTPLGRTLTASDTIEVVDDGHGMTPQEVRSYFLVVGRDRRADSKTAVSRIKRRPVMGRKGIGKLAPFGICKRIEVISAGGKKTSNGYEVANFVLDFDKIVAPDDTPVECEKGPLDRTWSPKTGTTIRLSKFHSKRVPSVDVMERQLGRRIIVGASELKVQLQQPDGTLTPVPPFDVPMDEATIIDVSTIPVQLDDGTELKVSGKVGMAIKAYQNPESTGVRIYARGKLVATTRDFEQPAGFTGEFTLRSYLVGSIKAEWLDLDTGDDLVRTDRQGILWESEWGTAFRRWGAELIKRIGKTTREPRRKKARDKFLERSGFSERAGKMFKDASVVDTAIELAGKVGSFAAPDELDDDQYIEDLSEFILAVAPHKALIDALKEFTERASGKAIAIGEMSDLFGKSRVAEMASYSQIASERVRIIEQLDAIIFAKPAVDESDLQNLIAEAPWLIEPTWAVITSNQRLSTFRKQLQTFLTAKAGAPVVLALEKVSAAKRPDFLLVSVGHMLHLVEIKKVGHTFDDGDAGRLLPYFDWLEEFFQNNSVTTTEFPLGFRVDLIADDVKVRESGRKRAFAGLQKDARLLVRTWNDFLTNAENAHRQFLDARKALKA